MYLYKAIQQLYVERERLDKVIASLEELQKNVSEMLPPEPAVKRRGRKAMGAAERREVSQRMKKYWAQRRDGGDNPGSSES